MIFLENIDLDQQKGCCTINTDDTVDGSEIPNNHLGCIKPCK